MKLDNFLLVLWASVLLVIAASGTSKQHSGMTLQTNLVTHRSYNASEKGFARSKRINKSKNEVKATIAPISQSMKMKQQKEKLVTPIEKLLNEDQTNRFEPNLENCKRKKYCEVVGDEYPAEHIKKQLKIKGRSREVKKFLINNSKYQPVSATRAGDWKPLCDSKLSFITPKVARNRNKKWMYIVNLDDRNKQQFYTESCKHTGDCEIKNEFPFGYTFKCTQRYVYHQMAAIDNNGRPVIDYFELPSVCACYYKTIASSSKQRHGEQKTSQLPAEKKRLVDDKWKLWKEKRLKDKSEKKKKTSK